MPALVDKRVDAAKNASWTDLTIAAHSSNSLRYRRQSIPPVRRGRGTAPRQPAPAAQAVKAIDRNVKAVARASVSAMASNAGCRACNQKLSYSMVMPLSENRFFIQFFSLAHQAVNNRLRRLDGLDKPPKSDRP